MVIKEQNGSRQITFENGTYCHARTSTSNCKLEYMEWVSGLLGFSPTARETFVNRLKEVLKTMRITVALNTNDKALMELIKNNFETYYINEVPVGYEGNKIQYHILIKNIYSNGTKDYLRNLPKEKAAVIATGDKAKTIITKILKKHRRKTDIVDEILDELQKQK